VTLNPAASWVLVIGYIVFALVSAVLLLGIAFALRTLNAKLNDLLAKADPLLAKADDLLTIANEKVTSIGDKAEGILAQGEETAESVHEKVDKTAAAVQRTLHAPIININSLAAGVTRGVETFTQLQRNTALKASHSERSNGQQAAEAVPTLAGKETSNGG